MQQLQLYTLVFYVTNSCTVCDYMTILPYYVQCDDDFTSKKITA